MPVDLVLAGNFLVDDVVHADGRTRMGEAGGAMLYASLGAALWGARVGVVSVVGSDYPGEVLAALAARGVDLGGLRRLDRPGLRTWLLYERETRRVLNQLGGPTHEEVSPDPEHLPEAYESARAFHLSPMPLARQRAWVEHLGSRRGTTLSLDPHESVREDNLAPWLETLKNVDVFFTAEDELRLDGASRDPRAALRRLASGRLDLVAFKRGACGGLLLHSSGERFLEWSPSAVAVVDPTGAGDAFAGGFLAGLIAGVGLERALQQGAVSAGFAIEEWGARCLLQATREQAERRRREWFDSAMRLP